MKKLLSICLLVAMLVGCTNAPAENATPEATEESSEAETATKTETVGENTPKVMKTEAELGIAHPLRFADDIKIYDAETRLKRTMYEIPYQLDEDHYLLVEQPLAKGKLAAKVLELSPDHSSYTTTAIGYYDLVKNVFVEISDISGPQKSTSIEIEQVRLYALDESRLLYEVFHPDSMEYFTYTFADGNLEKLDQLQWEGDYWYPGRPHVSGDRLYLPAPLEFEIVGTHIYDRTTLEKIGMKDVGYDLYSYRGEDVSAAHALYANGSHEWIAFIGERRYFWNTLKDENFMGLGVTTEPEAVFFLSQYLGSHELDEDLTEEDRAWDPDLVQYQVLREMPEEKVIARLRGAYIDMQVTDRWVGLRKTPDQDEKSKRMAYIYLPGERTALRIIAPDTYSDFFLLPSEPYAVLYGDRGDYDTTTHVYVYEPKDKAQ